MDVLTHGGLKLAVTDEFVYIEAGGTSNEALQIDRLNFELTLIDKTKIRDGGKRKDICAVIGIVNLLAGPYLIVATSNETVGQIDGHIVFAITDYEVLPLVKSTIHLSEAQERDNQQYLAMVHRVLSTPGFYYSNTYDLTCSLQRKHHFIETKANFMQLPLHERADERFVWNLHLLRDLVVQPELRRFVVPIIHGFVSIKGCAIAGKPFQFILISRRSALRAGVRYYMRGADENGHVANYVETEQIAVYHQQKSSFVQTRGSVPLSWSQKPTLKYKPTPIIDMSADQVRAVQRHFDEQIAYYGQQVVINLLDQKGPEKKLSETFRHYLHALSSCLITYSGFDFHKECSKMRWHRLSILMDQVASKQEEFGFFNCDAASVVTAVQQGVFRTNCIDCLDRTNVVQSMFARRSLLSQFQAFGVLGPHDSIEAQVQFETSFKNVWADNADMCAKQYTGTGALKTDFTRTGKRTHFGLLNDGYNSAVRYYYNNFSDGFRQDSIDLFLGNYVVDRWEGVTVPSPLHMEKPLKMKLVPLLLLVGVSMLFMALILPTTDVLLQMMYVFFWSISVVCTAVYMYRHGQEFVDVPKLNRGP